MYFKGFNDYYNAHFETFPAIKCNILHVDAGMDYRLE